MERLKSNKLDYKQPKPICGSFSENDRVEQHWLFFDVLDVTSILAVLTMVISRDGFHPCQYLFSEAAQKV